MTDSKKNKIWVLVLCFVFGFTVAACSTRPEPVSEAPSVSEVSQTPFEGKVFVNTLELPAGPYAKFALPKLTEQVHQKYELNSDTVGWLQIPNTTVDDVVVWYPDDPNDYYVRRNFDKKYEFNGIFFADFRCAFNGGADGLSPNTVIYGHSMSDDPFDRNKQLSPTKLFKDPDFARETPYIYFSVSDSDLIWEVFAVFHSSISLPYNIPEPNDFTGLIKECRDRSLYNYETEVTAADKILTLSTCTYSLPDGRQFPISSDENGYRYVIMAKLVTDKSRLKSEASFEINPSPKAP